MKPVLFLLLGLFMCASRSHATICTASSAGNWESTSTWSCGIVPTCNDQVIIPAGITVTVTSILRYPPASSVAMNLSISGVLCLQPGMKLYLPAGAEIDLYATGSIQATVKGGSASRIEIGSKTVWRSSDGRMTGVMTLSDAYDPIEFLSFNVERCFDDACLFWTTAQEHNNNYFSLERSSDGIHFDVFDTINSAGNSNTPLTYSFVDHAPYADQTYYRLKQTDINGHWNYSKTVYVNAQPKLQFVFEVYPTPNDGKNFVLRFYSEKMDHAELALYTEKGVKCHSETISLSQRSITELTVHPKNALSPGTYDLEISKAPLNFHKKIAVE